MDRDRRKEKRDYLGHGAQARLPDQALQPLALRKCQGDKRQVHGERHERHRVAVPLRDDEERRYRRRTRDQRHAEGHDAKILREVHPLLGRVLYQLAGGEYEEDEASRDLEVPLADANRYEDAPSKDEEEEGDDAPGPRRLVGDPPAPLDGHVPAEREEDRREPDGVDRHEERDEALQEFSDKAHVVKPAAGGWKGNPPCASPRRRAQFPANGLPAQGPLRHDPAGARRAHGVVGIQRGPCRAPLEVPLSRPRRAVGPPGRDPRPRALPDLRRDPRRRASRLARDRLCGRIHPQVPPGPRGRRTDRVRADAVHRAGDRLREQPGGLRHGVRLLRHRPDGLPAPPECGGDRLAGRPRGPGAARRGRAAAPEERRVHGNGRAPPQLRRGHEGRGHPPRPGRPRPGIKPHHAEHRGRRPRNPADGRRGQPRPPCRVPPRGHPGRARGPRPGRAKMAARRADGRLPPFLLGAEPPHILRVDTDRREERLASARPCRGPPHPPAAGPGQPDTAEPDGRICRGSVPGRGGTAVPADPGRRLRASKHGPPAARHRHRGGLRTARGPRVSGAQSYRAARPR